MCQELQDDGVVPAQEFLLRGGVDAPVRINGGDLPDGHAVDVPDRRGQLRVDSGCGQVGVGDDDEGAVRAREGVRFSVDKVCLYDTK